MEMPELTGVAVLDFFIYAAAVFVAGATLGNAVKKWLDVIRGKKKDPYGRRAEDVEKLRDKVDEHGNRLAVVETEVGNLDEKVDGLQTGQETQRRENREDFKRVFEKLEAIHNGVKRNGENDGG